MTISDNEWQEQAEKSLMELVKGAEVTKEQLDKDGCPHTLTAQLPPNMDAVKFVLKNRSKGKWADKTETTHTQINVNLNASYKEVKELMAREKENLKQIPQRNEQIIDAEVLNADNKANQPRV